MFYFSFRFFQKHRVRMSARERARRARKKAKERSSSSTTTLLRWQSINPLRSIFYHPRSMDFEEKIEGLWTCQSSAVFSTILLIGSARSRRHCMEYTMWVRFCRIPVENFFVDSKSFPLEAIGIWKKILTDRTGSESSKFFWQPEMVSLPSSHWFKIKANSALDQ